MNFKYTLYIVDLSYIAFDDLMTLCRFKLQALILIESKAIFNKILIISYNSTLRYYIVKK